MKRILLLLSFSALVFTYACKKKKTTTDTSKIFSTISIVSPKALDTVNQTFDSTAIEFDVADQVKIDTVFMHVLNPNGGAMYYGYFIVNDKTLHYKGYHKLDDGITSPKTYQLKVEAHNSSKNSTIATREFVLKP